jgi:general secretion pathway protein D
MSQILEPLAPEGSMVRVDNLRNLIVLAGSSPEMTNLLDTIQVFDVDWMAGLSVGFFVLEYAKANEVVTQLETCSPTTTAIPSRACSGSSRWSANAVLVVSPQQSYLSQMEDWIDRLDRPRPAAARRSGSSSIACATATRRTWPMCSPSCSPAVTGGSGGTRSVGGVAPGLRQASIGGDGTAAPPAAPPLRRATQSTSSCRPRSASSPTPSTTRCWSAPARATTRRSSMP